MGLLSQLRPKARQKDLQPATQHEVGYYGANYITGLPTEILELIFSYVCPHTQDNTYTKSEDVPIESQCMLCDLRDLAHCLQTCSRWREIAERMLYTSIRIEPVHYCILEEELALRRRKTGLFKKSKFVDPVDVPGIRLGILCETLRGNRRLAEYSKFVKLGFQTRQSSKVELARLVAVTPNLRYVDLPEWFFSGHESCDMLRNELQAQCPRIGRMQYRRGAEGHLNHLLQRRWQYLEELELKGVALDTGTLQLVLASLPILQDLTLSDLPWLDDSAFDLKTQHATFAAIKKLKLEHTPNITAVGLNMYLSRPQNQRTLLSLTLHNTGIRVADLHDALWKANHLESLAIHETVSRALVTHKDTPFLSSPSLKTMTFEVEKALDVQGLQHPDESYYAYLAASLYASALPALTTLYVAERHFPERLLPSVGGLGGSPSHFLPNPENMQGGLKQTLQIFSKSAEELGWFFTSVGSSSARRHSASSSNHRVSTCTAPPEMVPLWAKGGPDSNARMSVVVSNGRGSFVELSQADDYQSITDHAQAGASAYDEYLGPPPSLELLKAKRASRNDLWR